MSKVNLQSVLDSLINEEHDQATELLHQWFVEACADINDNIVKEELHVHVHSGDDSEQPVVAAEDEFDDDSGNLSPINGTQDMDTDGDDAPNFAPDDDGTDPDMVGDDSEEIDFGGGELSGEDEEVSELRAELDDLKKQLAIQLGFDPSELDDDEDEEPADSVDTDPDSEDGDTSDDSSDDDSSSDADDDSGDDAEDDDKEDTDESFDDLEESFELEKVTGHDMTTPEYAGAGGKFTGTKTNSLALNKGPDIKAAKPVEIRAKEYTANGLQDAPAVKAAPLRKNQVKNAADNLEAVPAMGPKNALLNRASEIYPAEKNKNSLQDPKMRDK